MYKVIGSAWHTPPLDSLIIDALLQPHICIGVVAIESGPPAEDGTISWKAYIGYGTGLDESSDEQKIAANGSKLTKDVASAYFPHLPLEGWKS